MNKAWQDDAWEDYLYQQTQDRKTLKKINQLLKDIDRNFDLNLQVTMEMHQLGD